MQGQGAPLQGWAPDSVSNTGEKGEGGPCTQGAWTGLRQLSTPTMSVPENVVLARSRGGSIRDARCPCPGRSHRSETWEVKLFQGQLSRLLLEVGCPWLPHSELQAEAWRPWFGERKCTETCLEDVGEGVPAGLPGDPFWGFPVGGRAVNSQDPSALAPLGG